MSTEIPTPLPIGVSFFDSIIESGYYYVDNFEKLASGEGLLGDV